jgi:hypothetical protein
MPNERQIGYPNRNELIKELTLRLADGIVDVELDREHYDVAINQAIAKYRQLSANAVEESIMFLQLQPDVYEYTLPNEVMEVRRMYRRGVGTMSGTGTDFDPFDVAFNNMYLLNAGQIGGVATFDFFSQYKETIGRVFGSEFDFLWNRNTKVLQILRRMKLNEEIGVGVYNLVPEMSLLQDVYASQWLSAYALAQCKLILGEARSKYTSGLPGAPAGGITLNGDQLKAEGQQESEALLIALRNMEEGNSPLGFVIG